MNSYRTFQPDLIVEATSVCDRNCVGCYAPNLISKFSPLDLYRAKPELFLSPEVFEKSLLKLTDEKQKLEALSIRGGEPSRHPFLSELLQIAHRHARTVYVETHGRWILENSEPNTILNTGKELRTIFKISFDQMHGLSAEQLREITQRLSDHEWALAITEKDEAAFLETRVLCGEIPDQQVIYQKKASSLSSLVRPKYGIIHTNGTNSNSLTVKAAFNPIATLAEAVS